MLDTDSLEQITLAYGLGPITQHWPASHGIENRNFFIAVAAPGTVHEYVLTIMTSPPSAGSGLVAVLDTCAALGLPVPAPVRTLGGAAWMTLHDQPAMLCPRLPGRHVINPSAAQIAGLGRFMARLHLGTRGADFTLPPYPRDITWLTARVPECLPHLAYSAQRSMRDALAAVSNLLAREDVAQLPTGVIHGDLFRDNVLFNAWGLSGVLDFHHAAHGYWIYDLAVAANDWCMDPQTGLVPARLRALLDAYDGIRALTATERWFLPVFMLYAALAFWQSRLLVAVELRRGRATRANDPLVFERIVAQQLRSTWQLVHRSYDQKVAASD